MVMMMTMVVVGNRELKMTYKMDFQNTSHVVACFSVAQETL